MSLHDANGRPGHILLTTAREEAFSPNARLILRRLGYGIFTPEELSAFGPLPQIADLPKPPIEMVVLDEHRLESFLEEFPGSTPPILLLTGRSGIRVPDSRVVAAVTRPAGLHDLFRILQQFFEDVPRATPRVATRIRASCRRREKTWSASVISLSENGCLLLGSEDVPLGSHLHLTLRLPRIGTIELEAESAYQLVPDLGLVFNAVAPRVREAIESYVLEALAPA